MAYGLINADIHSDSQGGVLAPISSVMRNRIINGQMQIDQRNAGASVTPTATAYTVDRWQLNISQASKLSAQQLSSSPPVGFSNYLALTSQSAYSVTSTDYFFLVQYVEGFNWCDLGWGTANAKTVTLSFWVQSSLTGTFGGVLQNYAASRSYPFTYSIPTANTWTQISVTIAGDTSGTWVGATNGGALQVIFGLGAGSTRTNTAGSWYGSASYGATGATSVVGTSGATFYITGVQLEKGSSATGFEYRQYGQELALCQRYYETQALVGNYGGLNQGGYAYLSFNFAVQKRTAPTMTYASMTYISNGTGGTGFTPNFSSSTVNQFYVGSNGFSNFNGLGTGTANASAEL